jgi:hypothetical protein
VSEKETGQHTIASLRSELDHVRAQLRDKETQYNTQLTTYEGKIEGLTMDLLKFKETAVGWNIT